jgi:hypothetical protein
MKKYTLLIERYFDGLLTAEEHTQFDQLKATDSDFQTEFAVFEKAQMILELDALRELKENARNLDKEVSIASKKTSYNWMKLAASILLLAVVGSLFYTQNTYSNESLYQDNYAAAGDHISDLGSGKTALESAMQFYNLKKYPEAIGAFEEILSTESENQAARFYLGQSQLLDNKSKTGIATLRQVTGDYRPEALWHVALAQLQLDKEKATIATLSSIIESNEDQTFVKKAKKLKAKLESPLRKFVF